MRLIIIRSYRTEFLVLQLYSVLDGHFSQPFYKYFFLHYYYYLAIVVVMLMGGGEHQKSNKATVQKTRKFSILEIEGIMTSCGTFLANPTCQFSIFGLQKISFDFNDSVFVSVQYSSCSYRDMVTSLRHININTAPY